MTIRDPFDITYSSPDFDPGTRAITMQEAHDSTPGNGHVYYLSRRFTFPEGDYVFKARADDAVTIWVGETSISSRLTLSASLTSDGGLAQTSVHIPEGMYRVDMLVTNMPPAPNDCYVALNIHKDGAPFYLSDKFDWLLDDAPISDNDLPLSEDPRTLLPVFSVLPNWKNGLTERLTWMTDVLGSESDAEQRRAVRRHPRRSIEAEFLRAGTSAMRLDNFFVGMGKSKFMMPLWMEQLSITTGISEDASGVIFEGKDGHLREFRQGDLAFVSNGDPNDYDILRVGAVTDLRFDWATPPQRAWPPGTRVYPLREARLMDDPQETKITDGTVQVRARFDLAEPDIREPSWGATVNGEPAIHVRPNFNQAVEVTYSRKAYTLDNGSGVVNVTDTGRYSTANMRFSGVLVTRENTYAFRQFLAAARGRARHFYCPTFTNDVAPFNDIHDNTVDLIVRPTGYALYMSRPQPLRLTMAFILRDGANTIYRRITNVTAVYKRDVDDNVVVPAQIVSEIFTLDLPLPAIELSEIHRISFVTETRFDQDAFELHHSVAGAQKVQFSLTLRQAQNPRKDGP